ncbi:MAG: hypothetical protein WC618_01480 [Patescibacteria group bacterium]
MAKRDIYPPYNVDPLTGRTDDDRYYLSPEKRGNLTPKQPPTEGGGWIQLRNWLKDWKAGRLKMSI